MGHVKKNKKVVKSNENKTQENVGLEKEEIMPKEKEVVKNCNFKNTEVLENAEEKQEIVETVEEEKELTFKSIIKPLLKLFMIPLILFGVSLTFFTTLQIYSSSFQNHFISDKKKDIFGQKEDLYILSTYYQYDKISVGFVKEVKKAAKEVGYGYYFIDIEKYPSIVQNWNITKSPSYYLIDKNAPKPGTQDEKGDIIYASYGNKDSKALATEIKNVVEYGMPQNDVNLKQNITNESKTELEVTLKEISKLESIENRYKVTFTITNKTDKNVIINSSDFSARYNPFKNESENDKDLEYHLAEKVESITIKPGGEKEITLLYSKLENKEFRISINFNYKGKKYTWNYKLWQARED